jgi:hypothetical protein
MLNRSWRAIASQSIPLATVLVGGIAVLATVRGQGHVLIMALLMLVINWSAMSYFVAREKGQASTFITITVAPDDTRETAFSIDLMILATVVIVTAVTAVLASRVLL